MTKSICSQNTGRLGNWIAGLLERENTSNHKKVSESYRVAGKGSARDGEFEQCIYLINCWI